MREIRRRWERGDGSDSADYLKWLEQRNHQQGRDPAQ
jgi:hypothetical protein